MGIFSWLCKDTDRQIALKDSQRRTFTVYMHGLMPDSSRVIYREDEYEGYGEFGGKDLFVLMSEMNPDPVVTTADADTRSRGIDLYYWNSDSRNKDRKLRLRYPILTETPEPPSRSDFWTPCSSDPDQGCGSLYFSHTQDTARLISSKAEKFTVYMHGLVKSEHDQRTREHVVFVEDDYSGSCEFGGKNYYHLLSEMNPYFPGIPKKRNSQSHLRRGMCFPKILYPVLTESPERPPKSAFRSPCQFIDEEE